MLDRLALRQRLHGVKAPVRPAAVVESPVQRCFDAFGSPPGPTLLAPHGPVVVATAVDEGGVVAVRHESAVEPKRPKIHVVRGLFVVVRPDARAAERERAAADPNAAACRDVRRPFRVGTREPGQRQRLRHRLAVLKLVLYDHRNQCSIERPAVVATEHRIPNVPHVRPRRPRRQERQTPALRSRMRECVVEIVGVGQDGGFAALPHQPELLEMRNVREVPHERRLDRRDLARELVVREPLEQLLRPPPRALERYGGLRR